MIKSKFAKAFILSIALTLVSAAAVNAAETGSSSPGYAGGSAPEVGIAADSGSADGVASSPIMTSPVSEEIIKKQKEIDAKLFDQYKGDLEKRGITVTHTFPTDKYIEIGILPLNQENSEYLYGILGKGGIKLVDGEKAAVMPAVAPDKMPAANPGDQPVSSGDKEIQIYTTTQIEEDGAVSATNAEDGREPAFEATGGRAVLYGAPSANDMSDNIKNNWWIATALTLTAAAAAVVIGGVSIMRKRKAGQN